MYAMTSAPVQLHKNQRGDSCTRRVPEDALLRAGPGVLRAKADALPRYSA